MRTTDLEKRTDSSTSARESLSVGKALSDSTKDSSEEDGAVVASEDSNYYNRRRVYCRRVRVVMIDGNR